MATVKTKQCDVFGTFKGVKSYRIVIAEVLNPDGDGKPDHQGDVDEDDLRMAFGLSKDLSPRALKRLTRFIIRGVTSPTASVQDSIKEDSNATSPEPQTQKV